MIVRTMYGKTERLSILIASFCTIITYLHIPLPEFVKDSKWKNSAKGIRILKNPEIPEKEFCWH